MMLDAVCWMLKPAMPASMTTAKCPKGLYLRTPLNWISVRIETRDKAINEVHRGDVWQRVFVAFSQVSRKSVVFLIESEAAMSCSLEIHLTYVNSRQSLSNTL